MTRHQYGISAVVAQTSFGEETSGGVGNYRLLFYSIDQCDGARVARFPLTQSCSRFSGIVRWGNQVQRILDDGRLLLQQTRAQDITSPITVLLEGWYQPIDQLFYWLRRKWQRGGTKTRLSERFCPYQPVQ